MIKIQKTFSSIGVKLFLAFWLIVIISIIITRIVTTQLEQQSIIIPNHQGDLRKLNHLVNRIQKRQATNIQSILKHAPISHRSSILIKDIESGKIFNNKNRYSKPIATFLAKNSFNHHASIQFPFARVTGPELINFKNKQYQLFIAVRANHQQFSTILMQMPFWIKIIIPLLISSILCWLLARTITKPILAIKSAATKIGNGNYDTRVTFAKKRNDELGEMSKSFNQMAEKLSTNITAHQRLLADVSHELRSPMTRLQIALGLIEKSAEQGLSVDKHLSRCEQEITQLDSMINNVLSLSRMENTFHQAHFEKLNFKPLLQTSIEDAQYLANNKSVIINADIKSDCSIAIDPALILSALNNILINAIKHSEQEGSITVSVTQTENALFISVSDNATGVPEEKLPLLFKPFYRVSTARDRETGGTGLGLAIAKHAIDIHHGKISAENNHSGGLTITIELPLDNNNDT